MKITVITPTLNVIDAGRKKALQETLGSVQAQTHGDIEHLIMDGGSTDGTAELVAALEADGAIAGQVSEPDTGVYAAMNRGAARATGDYLMFLNSDDFYHRADGLAEVAKVAGETGAEFLCSPVRVLSDPPSTYRVSPRFARILMRIPFGHPGMAIRREVFHAFGGFDEAFRISGDYDLMLRLVAKGASSAVIERPIVSYRPGGVSADEDRRLDERVAMMKKNFDRVLQLPEADWRDAFTSERLPARFLRAMLASREVRWHMKAIAFYQLVRTLRPERQSEAA